MTIIMTPAYSSEEERQRNREHALRVCMALRDEVYARRKVREEEEKRVQSEMEDAG